MAKNLTAESYSLLLKAVSSDEETAALFRAIGEECCKRFDGAQCLSYKNSGIDDKVLFFIFPNSKIGKDKLNKDNALELIKTEALKKFEEVKTSF